jgi:ABC-type sulfate transport system permease subunit
MPNYPTPQFPTGLIIAFVFLFIFLIAAQWRIFTKAGKPGWACLIPIYGTIVLLEIVGKPTWWVLLILFPCTSIIYSIWLTNLLSKSFGKEEGFTIGLLLLPFVFYPILAFGNVEYVGPSAAEANKANRFGADDYQKPTDLN